MPNETYITTTNAPSGGVGNLGSSADSCTAAACDLQFMLVDFFNVGPAISTADRLNGVENPVGRMSVSTAVVSQTSSASGLPAWNVAMLLCFILLAVQLVNA